MIMLPPLRLRITNQANKICALTPVNKNEAAEDKPLTGKTIHVVLPVKPANPIGAGPPGAWAGYGAGPGV